MVNYCRVELLYGAILLISCVNIGFVTSYSFVSSNNLKKELEITFSQYAIFDVITYFAAICGPYISYFVLLFTGRKIAILILMIMNSIMWFVLPSLTKKIFIIGYIDRAFFGIIVGALSTLLPIYLIEISPPKMVGLFGSIYQTAVFFGNVVCDLVGNYLDWKDVSYIGGGISLFFLFMIWFMPDSPESKHHKQTIDNSSTPAQNKLSIAKLRNSIFHRDYIQQLSICILLVFFQTSTGFFLFRENIPYVFKEVGFILPELMSYSISEMALVLFSIIGSILIQLNGREVPFSISSFGICIPLIIQAISLKVEMPKSISFFTHHFYFAFYSFSLAIYPSFAAAELFPTKTRSIAVAITTSFYWLFYLIHLVISQTFQSSFDQFIQIIVSLVIAVFGCIFGLRFVHTPNPDIIHSSRYFGIKNDDSSEE